MKSTQQRIAERNAAAARFADTVLRSTGAFEPLDFPQLFNRRPEPHPADVPNRLFGASRNEEGDAI